MKGNWDCLSVKERLFSKLFVWLDLMNSKRLHLRGNSAKICFFPVAKRSKHSQMNQITG
jgi:hypothetical protein